MAKLKIPPPSKKSVFMWYIFSRTTQESCMSFHWEKRNTETGQSAYCQNIIWIIDTPTNIKTWPMPANMTNASNHIRVQLSRICNLRRIYMIHCTPECVVLWYYFIKICSFVILRYVKYSFVIQLLNFVVLLILHTF